MGSLLTKHKKAQPVQLQYDDTEGVLVCKQTNPTPRILSNVKWTSVFLVLSYVYLDTYEVSHPHNARELLQYMENK